MKLNRVNIAAISGFVMVVALIGCMFHSCVSDASAQPRVSYAKGWPVILKGGDWDSGVATDRIGIGYAKKVGDTVFAADIVLVLGDSPRANFQFPVNAGWALTERLSLAVGAFYQINPGYGDTLKRQMVGVGVGPGYKVQDNIQISFSTGPSILWGEGLDDNVIGFIFLFKTTFYF